ncbi:sporulation initiation factor Spo0A C-terminal domain-containing protein [Dysosmobacter acutus]
METWRDGEKLLSEIYDLLYRMGLTANYTGFFRISYAIYLSVENPQRLALVTKWLYPEVARHYGTTWQAVERNIRSAIAIIWNQKTPILTELFGAPLPAKPRNAQFLALVAGHFSLSPVA